MVAAPVIQALSSLLDMRGPVLREGGDRALARGHFDVLIEFFSSPSPIPIPRPVRPFFSTAFFAALQGDLNDFLTEYAALQVPQPAFSARVGAFLDRRDLRQRFPEWADVLMLTLMLPLSNATSEMKLADETSQDEDTRQSL